MKSTSETSLKTLIELVLIPSVYGKEEKISRYILSKLSHLKTFTLHNNIVSVFDAGKKKTIGLVGHMDTVDTPNAFSGRVIDGKVYGVGASDMKAGLAVMLEIAKTLKEKNPKFNIVFVFYEKEEGPLVENGLRKLLKDEKILKLLKNIDLAFVLEPTANEIQAGCLGTVHAWFEFEGISAHSARPWEGENAIHKGWKLLKTLSEYKANRVVINGIEFFEVINATMVEYEGGRNLVPSLFKVNANYRFSPLKKRKDVEEELKSLQKECGADRITITDFAQGSVPCVDNPVLKEFIERFNLKVSGKQAWTDVAQLSAHGIDAVNFGPGLPSQAHKENEYADVNLLMESVKIFKDFLFE